MWRPPACRKPLYSGFNYRSKSHRALSLYSRTFIPLQLYGQLHSTGVGP